MLCLSDAQRTRALSLATAFASLVICSLVFVVATPVLAARWLSPRAYDVMCRLQGALSDSRRRRRYGNNSLNRAAQLPEEILLHIFHLLRTRAHFGSSPHFWLFVEDWPGNVHRALRPGLRDVASARLACLAWYVPATEVLYTDAIFRTVGQCIAFADTLVAHPRLALSVKRIFLPPEMWQIHVRTPGQLDTPVQQLNGKRWLDVKAASDRIMIQCSMVESIVLFGSAGMAEGMSLLSSSFRRPVQLTCCRMGWFNPADAGQCNFDLSMISGPPLELLALRSWTILETGPTRTLRMLHTLRLMDCSMEHIPCLLWLSHLSSLRSFFWRLNSFPGTIQPEISLSELLLAQRHILVDCEVHGLATGWLHSPSSDVAVTLVNLDAFSFLRTLSITEDLLEQLKTTPPRLRELDILFSRAYEGFSGSPPWYKAALGSAGRLRYQALFWRECSPSFCSIRFWDSVASSQFRLWGIISFLLRDFLAGVGMELTVNLTLRTAEEVRFRQTFEHRKRVRRLLWKDVF